MSAWPCRQGREGQGRPGLPAVPSELPLRPAVPSRAGLRLGRAATCLPGRVAGQSWARLRQGSAGGEKPDGCRGTGGTHSARARGAPALAAEAALLPRLELVEGKIVCDDAASEPSVPR